MNTQFGIEKDSSRPPEIILLSFESPLRKQLWPKCYGSDSDPRTSYQTLDLEFFPALRKFKELTIRTA
jgi:hypothetical protein